MKTKATLAALLLSFTALFSANAETRRLGNWWWWPEDGYDATVCDQYLEVMHNAAVTEIYFYGCSELMAGGSKWDKLHAFVQKAMSHNMRVAFLYDDWPDFDTDGGTAFLNKMVPQFLAYKARYPQDAVYGIHFDIELNKSGGYNATSLQHYCDAFIDKIQSARAQGIHCEVDVGCGWGNQGGASCVYKGVTGIYNIIARYTDTVAMMSYRDTAQEIVNFANQSGALDACIANGVEFLLGVETDDAGEGDKVDFCAEDKPYLFGEIDKVFDLIAARNVTAPYGMAIHQSRSFMNLPGYIPDGHGRNSLVAAGSTTVYFDGNGATSGAMSSQLFTAGVSQALTANAFKKTDSFFMGWSLGDSGVVDFTDGQVLKDFTTEHNVTLKAVWCSLGQAADLNGKAWSTGTTAPWWPTFETSHDGKASIMSGAATKSAASWTSVAVSGPGTLSFWVKTQFASSKARLTVSADATVVSQFSGNTAWQQVTVSVPEGAKSVKWSFENPDGASATANRAWLDQVTWTAIKPPRDRHRIGCFWDKVADAEEPVCTQYLDELKRAGVTEIYFGDTSKIVKDEWTSLHAFIQKAMDRGMRVAIMTDYFQDFETYNGLYFTDKLVPAFQNYLKSYPNDDLYGIVLKYETYKADTTKLQKYCDLLLPKAQVARQAGICFEVTTKGDRNSLGGQDVVYEGTTGFYDILAKNVDGVILNAYWDTESKIMETLNGGALASITGNGCDLVVGVKTSSTGKSHESYADNDRLMMFQEMDKVFTTLESLNLTVDYGMSFDNVRDFMSLSGDIPDGNGRNEGYAAGTCTVTFDGNGATSGSMANLTFVQDVPQSLPPCAFERQRYTFKGWSLDETDTVVYADGASVVNPSPARAVTFRAVWEKIPVPPRPQSSHRRIGNWWWHPSDGYTEPTCTQYLDELQKACVSEIYFYGYSSLKADSRAQLHQFVQKAMARGMRVAILFDDWDDFKTYKGDYFTSKLIPRFLEYRQAYPEDDLYGFHFDIEPGNYSQTVLQEYCDLFIEKVQIARELGIHCEVDVACGWNSRGGTDVTFRGTKGIYNIVAQYFDTVAFMSYRDVAQKIIDFANLAALPAAIENDCDFLVGVETANSGEGDSVDFYEEDKPYLFQEMDKVFDILDGMGLQVGYGMAIHQTRAFAALSGSVPDGNGRNTWGTPAAPTCRTIAFASSTGLESRTLTVGDTVPGVQYTVFASTDLAGPYTAIRASVPCLASATSPMTFELPDLGDKAFFIITASTESFKAGDRCP